jgi:hypothetical protein
MSMMAKIYSLEETETFDVLRDGSQSWQIRYVSQGIETGV